MTATMAKDRLKQRFDKWDVNRNGVLERNDFEREADRIIQAFGQPQNSPEARNLKNAFIGLYEHQANAAGVGPNGSITEDQFRAANEKMIFQEGEASFNRALRPVLQAVVGLCDKDHDGQINSDEFAAWLQGVGVNQADALSAFEQIDTSGDGQLTVDELLAAVRNFHFGKLDVALLG